MNRLERNLFADDLSARLAINSGANVNAKDESGYTPLHGASIEVSKLLIEKGADVNSRSDDGSMPLHSCTDADKAKILIEAGADVNARSFNKNASPLSIEINKEKYGRFEGDTPLHRSYSRDVAQVLINAGADISAKNNDGLTPSQTVSDKGIKSLIDAEVLKKANEKIHTDSLKRQEAMKEQQSQGQKQTQQQAHQQRF